MNSIKELKEQLGYEEIGLDDTFTFHCTQCGKCCIHREDILLSPKDLFNIAKKTMISIWNATLITLYLNYDITEDFQTQFQQNSDAILSLIETLGTVDIPKKS